MFLIPKVIELVAKKQNIENVDDLLEQTKAKTIEFLQEHLEEQSLLFAKKRCQNTINNICNQPTTFIKSQHFLVERFSSCCIFRSFSRSSLLRLFSLSHPPTHLPKFSPLIFSFLSPNPFLPHFLFLFSLPFFRLPFHRSEYKKTKAAAAAFVSVRKIIFSLPNRF